MHTLKKYKNLVTIEGLEHPYEAYVSTDTWNGWLVPFFTLAQCEQIIEDLRLYDTYYETRIEGGHIFVREEDTSDEWEQLEEATNPENPQETLYSLGGCSWTWEYENAMHTYSVTYEVLRDGYFYGDTEGRTIRCLPEEVEARAKDLSVALAEALDLEYTEEHTLFVSEIFDETEECYL